MKSKIMVLFVRVMVFGMLTAVSSVQAHEEGEEDAVDPLDAEEFPTDVACRPRGETCGAKAKKSKIRDCCKGFVCHEGRCARHQQVEMSCGKGLPPCMPGLTCEDETCK